MIKGRDFIFVGLQSWDIAIGSNCKNIALEVSKHNRVLYVSKPLDRISMLKHAQDKQVKVRLSVRQGKKPKLEEVKTNLWNLYPDTILESINWIGNRAIYDFFNKINSKRLSEQIQQAIAVLGFKDVIIFNDNDFISYRYLKEDISTDLYLYYIRDNLTSQAYFKRRSYLEEQMIAKADAVVTNSEYLKQYAARFNQQAHFVGQGCEVEAFTQTHHEKPANLASLPTPIIGYAGLLSATRLDINLIKHLAEQLQDMSIVLIGPQDASFENSVLHQIKNIYFLGSKKPEEIPAYMQYFDVCINPQIVNDMTIGNYPRKIDEYLAMGKPVVATQTLAMEYFRDYTYLSNSYEAFINNIILAIAENTYAEQEKRRAFALSHTWAENVANIYQVIQHYSTVAQNRISSAEYKLQK